MRNKIILLPNILVLGIMNLISQNACSQDQVKAKIDTVRIIIQHISDIDFVKQEYKLEFWLRFLSDDSCSLVNLEHQLTVVNAKKTNIDIIPNWNQDNCGIPDSSRHNNHFRKNLKISCTMIEEWNLNKFPFDNQELDIVFYNAARNSKWIKFIASGKIGYADTLFKKKLVKAISVENGWAFEKNKIKIDTSDYRFTDSTLSNINSNHSAIHISIILYREKVWALFFKLLIGMYIAFSVAAVALFIDISETHASFDLPVGGLFAAIANKYIIETILPETPLFTLVDFLHALTILFIFFIIFYKARVLFLTKTRFENRELEEDGNSSNSIRKERANWIKNNKQFNRTVAWSIIGLYIVINFFAIVFNHA